MFNRARFLIDILGPEGAKVLAKAAGRSSVLGHALVPRSIIAWLRANPFYNGEIPGSTQWVSFTKSEKGFTGCVNISNQKYEFQDASLFLVAGAVGVAVGLDSASLPPETKNRDLERLGKSIDLMARVRRLSLAKAEQEKCSECGALSGGHFGKCKGKLEKKAAENAGSTGTQAAPIAPKAPEAPTATAAQPTAQQISPLQPKKEATAPKPVTPKVPKPPTIKMARSEMGTPCPACARKQFTGNVFVGCTCFEALAKSVQVYTTGDEVELRLNGWDRADVVTLLEAFGRK